MNKFCDLKKLNHFNKMVAFLKYKYHILFIILFIVGGGLILYSYHTRRRLTSLHRVVNTLSKEVHDLQTLVAQSSMSSPSPSPFRCMSSPSPFAMSMHRHIQPQQLSSSSPKKSRSKSKSKSRYGHGHDHDRHGHNYNLLLQSPHRHLSLQLLLRPLNLITRVSRHLIHRQPSSRLHRRPLCQNFNEI